MSQLLDLRAVFDGPVGSDLTLPNNVVIRGIFEKSSHEVDALGTVTGTVTKFTTCAADVEDLLVGDVVEADGKEYSVAEIQPDSALVSRLILTATE